MDIGLGRTVVTLESRFVDLDQPVLLTGIQALLRLLMEQKRLDEAAGLNTASLVSGYRGSPLGGLDRELWAQKKLMAAHSVRFEPGLNEDLAATMLYGTQELDAFPGAKVDGVYGMWYGKGPGVDRSGDALKCANMSGTHKHGGILAISGDDHGAHSSTYPHQTEYVFENCFIPVLNPASVQDVLDLGLAGWALSRYSGLWVAMKTTAETMEQASTAVVRSERRFITPGLPAAAARAELRPHDAFPRRPRRTGAAHDRGADARPARLGARQQARPADQRHLRRAVRADHHRQDARGHAARAAPPRPGQPPAACRLQDRHDLAAGDRGPARTSPAASAPSWSSRKSAASSRARSATRCITCRPTNAPTSAARPCRTARRC